MGFTKTERYNVLIYSTAAIVVAFVCSSDGNKVSKIVPGQYKIKNVQDSLFLTIQGSNASFAAVVSDNWHNFREQRWKLTKLSGINGFHLTPERYTANNFVSFYRDAAKKYPIPETWETLPLENTGGLSSNSPGKFQLQNYRTKLCLTTAGRRRIVVENKCDRHLKTQQWILSKV